MGHLPASLHTGHTLAWKHEERFPSRINCPPPEQKGFEDQNNQLITWPPKSPNLCPVNVLDQQFGSIKAPSPDLQESNNPAQLQRSGGDHAFAEVTDEENGRLKEAVLQRNKAGRKEVKKRGDVDGLNQERDHQGTEFQERPD